MQTLSVYCFTALNYLPDAQLIGHHQVSMKDCPGFDVIQWAKSIRIAKRNVEIQGREEFGVV